MKRSRDVAASDEAARDTTASAPAALSGAAGQRVGRGLAARADTVLTARADAVLAARADAVLANPQAGLAITPMGVRRPAR